MKIKQFDKPTCRMVASAIKDALKAFEKEYGVVVETAGGKYSSSDYSPRITIKCLTESGVPASFAMDAAMCGCPEAKHGQKFMGKGGQYELVGFQPKRTTYPVVGRRIKDGKEMLFPTYVLQERPSETAMRLTDGGRHPGPNDE